MLEIPQWLLNVLNFGGLAAIGIGGWFMRTLFESYESLKKDLQRVELRMVQDYMPRAAIEQKLDMLFNKLDRIEDKLSNKADKGRGHE